jgi:hypothetical protein
MEPYTSDQSVRRVSVTVTTKQIEAALPADSAHCMIADAIKIAVPRAKAVNVDLASIRWTDPVENKRFLYLTPPSVQFALLQFDNGVKPKPFRFVLRAPAQITNAGADGNRKGMRVRRGVARVTSDADAVPTRLGGTLPPIGPLTNVSDGLNEARAKRFPDRANQMMQGRRRQFGLRKMGRPKEELPDD